MWGDGTPIRQSLFVDDLAHLIPQLLERHDSHLPMIIAPNECLTIDQMARSLLKALDIELEIQYTKTLTGQAHKAGHNFLFERTALFAYFFK